MRHLRPSPKRPLRRRPPRPTRLRWPRLPLPRRRRPPKARRLRSPMHLYCVTPAPADATPPAVADAPVEQPAAPVETPPAVAEAPATPETPVEAPITIAEAPAAPAPPADAPAVLAPKLQPSATGVIIRRGDTLWRISRRVYGKGIRYSTIYLANQTQIEDPDRIWPGQVFKMPDRADRRHLRRLDQHGQARAGRSGVGAAEPPLRRVRSRAGEASGSLGQARQRLLRSNRPPRWQPLTPNRRHARACPEALRRCQSLARTAQRAGSMSRARIACRANPRDKPEDDGEWGRRRDLPGCALLRDRRRGEGAS